MIDNETDKEMHKVYTVRKIVECNDCGFCEDFDYCQYGASCNVSFHERFTDDDQHFLHLEYHFDSIWSDEMDFKALQYIVEECNLCVDELNIIRKTLKGNWEVKLTDDIVFSCHHEIEVPEAYYWCSNSKDTIDLGKIAECYDDCSLCHRCCEGVTINGRDDLLKALRGAEL